MSDDAAPCPSTTATTTAALVDKKSSTLTLLEHVNLNVPNHDYILDFYLEILGMGLDPRRAGNVAKGNGTVWSNCGATQFHLSFGEEAQVVPGSIGLWYDQLDDLKERLSRYDDSDSEKKKRPFDSYSIDVDARSKKEHVRIVDRYGNVFYCRQNTSTITTDDDNGELIRTVQQPFLTSTDVQNSEDYRSSTLLQRFAMDDTLKNTDCRGISYIEFYVPQNTAAQIAEFYDCVFDAPTNLVTTTDDPETSATDDSTTTTTTVAIVGVGSIDAETGRTSQCLLFRESELPVPPYDGHHLTLYVGDDGADFEAAFKSCTDAGVVWVNPRFNDRATNLTGAKKWKLFRFKDILDLKTGKKIFELEHEVRSIHHDGWPGGKR